MLTTLLIYLEYRHVIVQGVKIATPNGKNIHVGIPSNQQWENMSCIKATH